ncbi:MAG: SDR family NAD(P)-dependent oxidoreductase [Planctomycetota bacterium]|jgi:NAD(P)-dependent dehydrogenase (short-subunit alcohol dehydrogenase family)
MGRAKVAFVTGGGRGIGRACAQQLAAKGLAVAVGSRSVEGCRSVASEIVHAGGAATAVRLDVTDPESVYAAVESAETALGPVDVLVCGAGISSSSKLMDTDLETWNDTLAVNLTGPWLCMKAVIHGMIERNFGRIVVIGSTASLRGAPYISAYAASKHGVMGLVRSLAAEVIRKDITVNAVCPGFVDTPMTDASIQRIVERTGRTPEEARLSLERQNPQGRLLSPDEVADAVVHLAREDSAAVTGQGIVLGGES